MNLAQLSIRRPILISCLFFVVILLGALSYNRLTTELYPDVSFPVINVTVPYPGAGPEEVENELSKPLENALGSLPGIRSIRSFNLQGAGVVTAVFGMDTDIRFAEQKVIETVARVRGDLPRGIMEPSIRTIDPSDVPLFVVSLKADLNEGQLYDLTDREIRPLFEQVPQVGLVEIAGGRKREIQVLLDRDKLAAGEMSAGEVINRLGMSGLNIPAGQIEDPNHNVVVRAIAQFDSLDALRKTPIRFVGNEILTKVGDIAEVTDGLEDERSRVYINGQRALTLRVFRQSKGNAVGIADALRRKIAELNSSYPSRVKGFELAVVHDGTKPISDGVRDAKESIEIGIILTILVVFFFLGSVRSTVITGIAIPNSLLGAFLLMWVMGFSLNITTLAALSLAVGLLIDDAIVVRESIFRRIEHGEAPRSAAVFGTQDVALAVIATTLTVLSVFGPVAFLRGIIGQFFKEFGLTICFAMLISLFDSLTVAPMLSAYFAGRTGELSTRSRRGGRGFIRKLVEKFELLQQKQEHFYLRWLGKTLERPKVVLLSALGIFALSFVAFAFVPKSFVPPAGAGEFQVLLESKPGTALLKMDERATEVDYAIRKHGEVERTLVTVGGEHGETNQAQILVLLKPSRKLSTEQMKDIVRGELKGFQALTTSIEDVVDIGGGAGKPFVVNVTGENLDEIRSVAEQLVRELGKEGDLVDLDTSYRTGASELQIRMLPQRLNEFGVSSTEAGGELRLLLAGATPAHFHEGGRQYDIHVRLRDDQRDSTRDFEKLSVPNLNHRLIPLSRIAERVTAESPSNIRRENRKRFIEVTADVNVKGRGLAHALDRTRQLFSSGAIKLPPGVGYEFAGQTKDFQDLLSSALLAVALSIAFMYLVLASLYESFFTPFTIMLVLPLAVCGAFYALKLTGSPLEINSMIGCILLMGVAAKNSILLVDHIREKRNTGLNLHDSIIDAGKVRLRPIMMTSFALIAGMLPVAIPLEESARSRSGMAIAVIGGLVSSTLLTLVVVPAAYEYIERFEQGVMKRVRRLMTREKPSELTDQFLNQ